MDKDIYLTLSYNITIVTERINVNEFLIARWRDD